LKAIRLFALIFTLATQSYGANALYQELFASPTGLTTTTRNLAGLPITVCNRILAEQGQLDVSGRLPILRGLPGFRGGPRGIVGPDPSKYFTTVAPEYLIALSEPADFLRLAKTIRTSIGEQHGVKMIWHRPKGAPPKLFFMNTELFPYHYFFAQKVLGFRGDVEAFNANYMGPGDNREFIQATLSLVPNEENKFLLEFFNGDEINARWIADLRAEIVRNLEFNHALAFHPTSEEQEVLIPELAALAVPTVTTRELYGSRKYIALNESKAVGYVKFVDPDDQNPLLDHTMIAVFARVPNDIGVVGGVITEEIQPPLSHVNVKCIGRKNAETGYTGTANMSLVNARTELKKYEGQCVELIVGPNGYTITPIPEAQAGKRIAEFWADKKPKLESKIESIVDHEYRGKLITLSDYYRRIPTPQEHRRLILMVGAKAANLGLINMATRGLGPMGLTSPGTVGIPFTFYDDFMQLSRNDIGSTTRATLQQEVLDILAEGDLLNGDIEHPITIAHPLLERARNLVKSAAVPESLIAQLKKQIWEDASSPLHYSKNPILLFRSSTNSEDLKGFTGAGLYNSKMVRLWKFVDGKAQLRTWDEIEKDMRAAISYVYSSVWNDRAYQEREWFGIKGKAHLDVKVGIAVHGGFADTLLDGEAKELANGVAITGNINAPDELEKIYTTAQFDDLPITNPPSTEELLRRGIDLKGGPYVSEEILFTTMLAEEKDNADPDSWKKWSIERLRQSSIRTGSVFSTPEEARLLAVGLKQVKYVMARAYGLSFPELMVDVEWNIMGVPGGTRRQVSLNQGRIFGMSKER